MRFAFAGLLLIHALIHLMGFARAFGLAELAQLTQPISRPMGVMWLGAAIAMLAAAGAFAAATAWAWVVGAAALLLSQSVILGSWSDARFGTVANVVLFLGVLYGFLAAGPWSFRAEYRREVERGLARGAQPSLLTESDLASLPAAVQRYLRVTGSVGQPRVESYRVRFRGQIRSGPDAQWMSFTADQHSFREPAERLFLMRASRAGLPFEALHIYRGAAATMRVKLASLVRIVEARGPVMDQSETVTLFNDMCLLAPPMLIDPAIGWEELDARRVRATFTNAGHTIRAELSFNEQGELTDFSSEERSMSSADGRSFTRLRWTTPIHEYRTFGGRRLVAKADALWHPAAGGFAYGRFEIREIEFNPR